MSTISIAGRATRDGEIRESDNGSFLRFSIATDQRDKGEKSTVYFDCVIFGKRAEVFADWIKKGRFMFVSGALSVRQYESKADGMKTALDVKVDDIVLGPRNDEGGEGEAKAAIPF